MRQGIRSIPRPPAGPGIGPGTKPASVGLLMRLVGGDELLLPARRHGVVMAQVHRVCAFASRDRLEPRQVVLQLRERYERVDLGKPVAWRLTFRADTLVRLERVENGRVVEWVARRDTAHVSYRNESERRSLELTVTRLERVAEFDASTWSLPR